MIRAGLISTVLALSLLVACGDGGDDSGSADDGNTNNGSNDSSNAGGNPPGDGGTGGRPNPPDDGGGSTGGSPYENAAQNIIDTLNGVATILEGVSDGPSADAAVEELNAAEGRLKGLWSEVATLLETPTPEIEAMKEKWDPQYKAAGDRLSAAMKTVAENTPMLLMKIAPAVARVFSVQGNK